MTSASGPLPRPAWERFNQFSDLLFDTGSVKFPHWLELMEKTRTSASKLLNCEKNSIAFVKNTGVGLWIASRLVDWQKGDEIILPAGEFPSNVFPWLSLEERGVSIKWIRAEREQQNPIPKVTPDTILPLVSEKTKLLSVSFVQFDDGARRDIVELGKFCKKHGIIFVIDAIQGLGALPFDTQELNADFICSGSQKWLLSPPGVGILHVAPRWLERKSVPNIGWLSFRDPYNTEFGSFDDCLERLQPDARRFEEGTANFAGIAALGASIDLILSFGIDSISDRVKLLTDKLVDELIKMDCVVVSPRGENEWSGIVSFHHEKLDSEEIDKQFGSENIITSVRNGWLRVAVDFFNDESEILKLTSSLKKQLDSSLLSI